MKGILDFLLNFRWGEKSVIALYVSVVSGIIVSLQYDPATPFYSTSGIDAIVPFGAYWRSLHFYSSQLFFLLSALHFLAILIDKTDSLPLRKWIWLVGSLPVVVLLLFTGYVLRGDATGESAGFIAENIALSMPIMGKWINGLLFSISTEGMIRVYANHLIGLGVLWGILCWDHIRRFRVSWQQHGVFLIGLLLFCLIWDAPMEQERLGLFHIAGPWFFLGLQELLRYIQPFWAGILFPLTLLLALCLASAKTVWRKQALVYSAVWILVYFALSVVGALRG